jgi:hypothetical protein
MRSVGTMPTIRYFLPSCTAERIVIWRGHMFGADGCRWCHRSVPQTKSASPCKSGKVWNYGMTDEIKQTNGIVETTFAETAKNELVVRENTRGVSYPKIFVFDKNWSTVQTNITKPRAPLHVRDLDRAGYRITQAVVRLHAIAYF